MSKILNRIIKLAKLGFKFDKYIDLKTDEIKFHSSSLFYMDKTMNNKESGITNELYNTESFTISLTTYDKRIFDVYLTIESIMQQTLKANRIVLWLAEEDFNPNNIPETLKFQQKRGLTIKFCKDIRSYKKLIPSLKEYPNDVIITIDDDVIYNIDLLEKMIRSYQNDPQYIYFNRGHLITFNKNGSIAPYKYWKWQTNETRPSHLYMPTGVGGVLYPPGSFNEEVFNEEIFMTLCRSGDDIWFKAMSYLNNKQAKRIKTKSNLGEDYIENVKMQDIALAQINNGKNQNDEQLKYVFAHYNIDVFNSKVD